jgi:hypothetical protein
MFLSVVLGKDLGRVIALDGGTHVVGRGADCNVVLASDLVSRTHARIEARPNELVLTDLESSNGTFVNGARIVGDVSVAPGEMIIFGDYVCKVHQQTPPPPTIGIAPGLMAGNLTEIPPSNVLRAIAVQKKTGILNLTSPPLTSKITFARGQVAEVLVDTRKTRDPIQALTAILRWKGSFDFEPGIADTQAAALLGLDAVIQPIGSGARPSMMPKPPRPSRP